ncbi:MAG: iron-sulfur cluster assembly accessory protein [Balneolaceae bacterium]
MSDENLNDVIASLIDEEDDASDTTQTGGPAMPQPIQEEVAEGEEKIQLTERAARQIRRIKSEENLDENLYLRVAVEGGGCSGLNYKLGFDIRQEEDRLTESQGIDILVDPRHLLYLNGIQIDYPDGLDARGFTFENPNASESCGCGSSFAI